MFTKSLFPIYKNHFAAIWKTVDPPKLLSIPEKLIVPNLEIARFRARKGTREAKLKRNRARKLANLAKPQPIPKFLQRKVKVSAELERRRCTDENWLETQPIDNVWNMKLYRGKPNSVSEAVKILQDLHVPSLLNDPSALMYVTAEVDLKLKKKGRYLEEFNGIITFPHEFEAVRQNKIIAICKESQDQINAADAGAVFTGSGTLIKQILTGAIGSDEYDYIVCHPDMYKELNVLRGILKKKFPSAHNGLLRLDVDRAVKSFSKGIEYTLKRSVLELDFGWVNVCCGRLTMPVTQIEENIKHALNAIEKHKPTGVDHLFILRSLVWCDKSREQLKIPHWEYLPNYPENGVIIEKEEESESVAA